MHIKDLRQKKMHALYVNVEWQKCSKAAVIQKKKKKEKEN